MKLSNYSKIFKALSNEQRLEIFMMIYKKCCLDETVRPASGSRLSDDCCSTGECMDKAFTHVCGCMKISRSTVSHHMKELKNAGLISTERQGQTFRCRVNVKSVEAIKELFM